MEQPFPCSGCSLPELCERRGCAVAECDARAERARSASILAGRDKFNAAVKTGEQATHDRARDELKALERHLVKRGLTDEFSTTNLWRLVDVKIL